MKVSAEAKVIKAGYQLKAFKPHRDHEGGMSAYTAALYQGARKVGTLDDDGWGGEPVLQFVSSGERTSFEALAGTGWAAQGEAVSALVQRAEAHRIASNRRFLFTTSSDPWGHDAVWKTITNTKPTAWDKAAQYLATRHPGVKVYNPTTRDFE